MGRKVSAPYLPPKGWRWCSHRNHFAQEQEFNRRRDGYWDSFCKMCRKDYYEKWREKR